MRRVIDHSSIRYTVSLDGAVPAGGLANAIVFARVIDELTGLPPQARVAIESTLAGLQPRSAGDGLVGLAAIPKTVFPLLRTQAYNIGLRFFAERFVESRDSATLGPQASFPDTFLPVDLGEISLHRQPVNIRGRVGESVGLDVVAVGGATVRLTGIWRTIPPAGPPPPSEAPNVLSLSPGVYFARSTAVARVRRRALAPVVGDGRTLVVEARSGTDRLRVTNSVGLAAGQVLMVDAAVERTEYMTIASVAGAASPDGEATITLTYPMRVTHAAGSRAQRVTPQIPGADNSLTAAPVPGDTCLLCATLTNLGAPEIVEIHGGPNPSEFHQMSRFSVVSDASGFYRLPPLSRVAQLEIEVDDGVHTPVIRTFQPEYGLAENRLDFTFV